MEPDGRNRLQLENQRMEERLRMLKEMMSVEKAQREASTNNRSYWESGKRGPLSVKKSINNNTTAVEKLGKHKKNVRVSLLTGKEPDPVLKEKIQCGQCDQYHASMMCIECVENYCNMCFVKFHHKGSLSKHHVRPLAKATVKQFTGKVHQTDNDASHLSVGTGEEEKGHSLLEGNYDELASATMFQEALRSWRNSGKEQETSSIAVESVSCGVQAAPSDGAERKLLSSLESMSTNPSSNASSYFETLLLKRVKANPSFFSSIGPLVSPRIAPQPLVMEDDDIVEQNQSSVMISPYNLFYSSDCNHGMFDFETTDTVSVPKTASSVSVQELSPTPLLTEPVPATQSTPEPAQSKIKDGDAKNHVHTTPVATELALESSESSTELLSSKKQPAVMQPNVPSKANKGKNGSLIVKHTSSSSSTVKKIKKSSAKSSRSTPSYEESPVIAPVKQSLSEAALNASVEQIWKNSSSHSITQKKMHDLSSLFMVSVDKTSPSPPINKYEPDDKDMYIPVNAGEEDSVWLPGKSSTSSNNEAANGSVALNSFDLPPPSSVTTPFPQQQDQYIDDSDSDSNETLQWEEKQEEDERENEEEEEENELIRELASMCTLTSEEGRGETEEKEDEIEERVLSRLTIDDLIHDFDVFQDQIREDDDGM